MELQRFPYIRHDIESVAFSPTGRDVVSMPRCESEEPCHRRASYRIGVRHTSGDALVYWYYCTGHFRTETRRLNVIEWFDVVETETLP